MVCGLYRYGNSGLSGESKHNLRTGNVDGIDVIEIRLPYSNRDSFLKRTCTFIRFAIKGIGIALHVDYDLLFATSTPLTAGIPGIAMRALKPWKPFVFEVRDLWPELPKKMGVITNPLIITAMSFLEWLSYNCAAACIGLSPGIRHGIVRHLARSKPVAMIPNGCDLGIFRPSNVPFGGDRRLTAVFMGAHGIANGLDAVLDGAHVLKSRGREDIEILFVGDGMLKPELMSRAKKDGLDNCKFLDPLPKLELASMLQAADVGLMILADVPAFYYGTSPNKFFDYISAGLPVLNNYPGWLADLINEYGCGIALSPKDPQAFADALITLADDRELRGRMGLNARNLAESVFDRKVLANEFVKFLEKVNAAAK